MHLCKCGCGNTCKNYFVKGHNTKRGVGGDIKERLLQKIKVMKNGCWCWTGGLNRKGYGEIRLKNGKSGGKRASAYRVAYEVFKGPVSTGLSVLHHCDNPKCINPEHLFLGTPKDNAVDMVKKGRSLRGEKQPTHKLIEEQARIAKFSKKPLRVLAAKFGVSISAISKIRHGHNWYWLKTMEAGY